MSLATPVRHISELGGWNEAEQSEVQVTKKLSADHPESSKHIPSPFPTHPLTFKIVLWLLLISLSVFIDASQGDFPIRVTDFLQVFKTVSSNCYACLTDISYMKSNFRTTTRFTSTSAPVYHRQSFCSNITFPDSFIPASCSCSLPHVRI